MIVNICSVSGCCFIFGMVVYGVVKVGLENLIIMLVVEWVFKVWVNVVVVGMVEIEWFELFYGDVELIVCVVVMVLLGWLV